MKRKRFRKWICPMLSALLISCLCLIPGLDQADAKRVEIRVDGGPPGGGKNFRNTAMAEAIKRGNPDWDVNVITGPVSAVILGMMKRGEVECTTKPMHSLYELREARFGGKKLAIGPMDLRWIFVSNYYLVGFYVLKSVPVGSIDELLAKKYPIKVSVGQIGSEPYNMANLVLKAFGYTLDDLKAWGCKIHLQPSGRSIKMVRDGHIEGKFHVGTVPEPAWDDLSHTRELKILTLESEEVKNKLEELGFEKKVIPGDSYNFTTHDIPTVGMPNFFVVPASIKDDTAYNIARAVWEQRDFLKSLHPIFQRNLNKDVIQANYRKYGELAHPGAVKYWKELGFVK